MRIGAGIYERKDGRFEARYRKGISSDGKAVYVPQRDMRRFRARSVRISNSVPGSRPLPVPGIR